MKAMVLEAFNGDSGQSNIDFLFGVAVFLVTFLYVATFIPGLFVPYQPGAIDLSSVAYRTSAILAEDPGWYNYTVNGELTGNGSWENHQANLSRIGLADDKEHPNVLSLNKIRAMNELAKTDYSLVRDKMGLNGSIIYDVNLTVIVNDSFAGSPRQITDVPWPKGSQNIESIERVVLIDEGKELFVDCGLPEIQGSLGNDLFVNVSNASKDQDIIIRLYNFTTTYNVTFDDVRAGTGGIYIPMSMDNGATINNYNVTKNGIPMSGTGFTFTGGDVLDVTIHTSTFTTYPTTTMIMVVADSAAFPSGSNPGVYYNGDSLFKQKSVCYPGIMRLEVWSNAFA